MTFLMIVLLLIVLLLIGVPVSFALLASSMVYFLSRPGLEAILPQRLLGALDSFPLLAVPFFILAGSIMAHGGIADRLVGFCNILVGRFRGGLGQVNVLNSLFIGGMSGSSSADAAIDSKVLVPVMRRHGYSNGFASALTVASSSLSPILPPSTAMIIFGVITSTSVVDLFVAGYVPALLMVIMLMVLVWGISVRRGYARSLTRRITPTEFGSAFLRALPALSMPVLLLIGLRMGIFTPTELGAIAVVVALTISLLFYRDMSWRDIPRVLKDAVGTTAMVLLVVAAASCFGLVLVYEQVPQQISALLAGWNLSPLAFLLIVNLGLLVLGMFMESLSLLIILVPIIFPVAVAVGVDPVHLGILVILNLTIGAVSPPIGTVVFTVSSITKVKLTEMTREFLPFFGGLILLLLVLTVFPDLVTFLPRLWD